MTKFEFLGDLSRLIADLPQEEVDQAMEYYEDYFADAGPEKEQEIIRDFISPAYIAEQLREASLQRQKAAARSTVQEEEKQAAAARAAAAASKPPVYSRKLAAQAQKNASMATASGFVTQAPTVKAKTPAAQPAQAAPSPTPVSPAQATPTQAASSMITPAAPIQVATTASASPQINRATPPPSLDAAGSFTQSPTPAQAAASIATAPMGQSVTTAPVPPTPVPSSPVSPASQPQAPSPATRPRPQTVSAPQQPVMTAQPVSGTATPAAPQTASGTPILTAPQTTSGTPTQTAQTADAAKAPAKTSSMRNSIFRDDTEEDKKKAEEELARRNKTKVDIKSINSTTSKVDKKQARAAAKQNAAIEKENNAERYSSSKKMVIGIVLLVTCPIWLTLVGVILGGFALGVCAVAACITAGIGCFVASLASIALTLLALFSAQISTSVFTLGCIFFLFAAGCGLCFLGYKLITRILPGAYFSVKVLFSGIKAKLARLALK